MSKDFVTRKDCSLSAKVGDDGWIELKDDYAKDRLFLGVYPNKRLEVIEEAILISKKRCSQILNFTSKEENGKNKI